jgi:hypothetical protein
MLNLAHSSDEVAMSDEHLQNWVEHPALTTGCWRDLIRAIDSEGDAADTLERRGSLLSIFEVAMESVEKTIPLEEQENFKYMQWWHYRNYLLQLVLVAQELCVETLYAVTESEIAAGRMGPTDRLPDIAIRGMAQPHLTRAELLAASRPTPSPEKPVEKNGWVHKLWK